MIVDRMQDDLPGARPANSRTLMSFNGGECMMAHSGDLIYVGQLVRIEEHDIYRNNVIDEV